MVDIGDPVWSENDSSNTAAPPSGWPEGMLPSGVNDSGRMMMGATKRFWDRVNGTVGTAGAPNSYTLTYPAADGNLYSGALYTFRCNAANTGASTLDVGVGGALPLAKLGAGGTVPLSAGDVFAGGYYQAVYDPVQAQFVLLGGVTTAEALSALSSVSACLTSEIASLSNIVQTNLRSLSVVLEADISALAANMASVSGVIEGQITSLSARMNNAIAGDRAYQRLPIAWGSFLGNTPSLSTFFGFNVLSVTRSAPGAYIIRFTQHLDATGGIAVVASANAYKAFIKSAGPAGVASVSSIIITTIAAGDSTTHGDAPYVAFSVYGGGFAS